MRGHQHQRSRRIAHGFRRGLLGSLLIAFGTLGFGCCALGWLATRDASIVSPKGLLGRRSLLALERRHKQGNISKNKRELTANSLGSSKRRETHKEEHSRIRNAKTVLESKQGSSGPQTRSYRSSSPGQLLKESEQKVLKAGLLNQGVEKSFDSGHGLKIRRESSQATQHKVDSEQGNRDNKIESGFWDLLGRLARQRTILTESRLQDPSLISCGGSGTVDFKTWRQLARSIAEFDVKWPAEEPDLRALVAAAQGRVSLLNRRPSCAVVGNSGRLLQHEHGQEIDSKEMVIRFNWGTTAGYEKHVGSKSHVRIYNGPYVSQKQAGEITLAEIRDPALREWVRRKGKEAAAHAFAFDPEFLCHVWDWVGRSGDKPSTGLVGVILALKTCSSVDVFGFHYEDYFDPDVQPHYYDWERPKYGREKAHPFEREYALYKQLESAGMLRLH